MFWMMLGMMLSVVLCSMLLMFIGVQMVAMRHVRVMGSRFVIAFLMGLVRFTMMMGGRLEMNGGFFMMIMFGHGCVSPVSTKYALPDLYQRLNRYVQLSRWALPAMHSPHMTSCGVAR